ncbi:MAG TPA: phosphoglucosamine mutase [Candidatus Polarisedimenticolia bacterium]|nr:phosphoglucosamine mutase [Candidatus Polarisedimenticolia bacterium]
MKTGKRLFGTDGIRGTAGTFPLDPDTVTRVGAALARALAAPGGRDAPRLLIGRDTRESGDWIERAIASGARRAGAECLGAGIITTPGVAYLARTESFDAGVMISASHNPYRDNGIKIFSRTGYKLPDAEEAAIEAAVLDGGTALPGAEYSAATAPAAPPELVDRYARFLAESVSPGTSFQGLHLVLDCANGASSALAPPVFEGLGARVTPLFTNPDGRNINSGCGSLYPEGLGKAVVEHGADAGIAFDGDADRCLFVAADGRVADGDVLMYQAAAWLKEKGRLASGKVVSTVMSNLWLERGLADIGVNLARTQVGDKYVLEEMLRSGAVLGGEQSGHIIFADRATTGDGILTALRMTEILRDTGETVSDWLSKVKAFPQILLNVPVARRPDLESHPVIGGAAARVRERLGGTGRLVLRYSGTEPLARVMIEATDREMVDALARELADVIRDQIGADGA